MFDLRLNFFAILQIPWDGMGWDGKFFFPMGWDGTDKVVPWYDFVVPCHSIRSPGSLY